MVSVISQPRSISLKNMELKNVLLTNTSVFQGFLQKSTFINHKKPSFYKQLKEIGWKLRQLPREPVGAAWRILGTGQTNIKWLPYLEPFGVASAIA